MLSAYETLSRAKYGGVVHSRQTRLSLTAYGDVVLKRSPERVGLSLTNTTATDITIAFGHDAVNAYRITLQANGGTLILNANDDGEFVTTGIHAVSFGGGVFIQALEIIRTTTSETNP